MAKKRKSVEELVEEERGLFWQWKDRDKGIKASPFIWCSYVDAAGERHKESTNATTITDAKGYLRARRDEVRDGGVPAAGKGKIADLWEEYIEWCEGVKEQRNTYSKSLHFTKWIVPYIGNVPLRALDAGVIDRLVRVMRKGNKVRVKDENGKQVEKWVVKPVSAATCNRVLSSLSGFCKWAVKRKRCSRAVYDAVRTYERLGEAKKDPKERRIKPGEWKRLLRHAYKVDEELGQVLEVLYLTGARVGEIIFREDHPHSQALVWDNVEDDFIWLEGKGGKRRKVPINSGLRKVLRARDKVRHVSSPFVFYRPDGRAVTYNDLRPLWEDTRRRARLDHVRMHDIRHTAASVMVDGGVPIYSVQAILGHSTPLVTQQYSHLSDEALLGATDTLSAQRPNRVQQRKKKGRAKRART